MFLFNRKFVGLKNDNKESSNGLPECPGTTGPLGRLRAGLALHDRGIERRAVARQKFPISAVYTSPHTNLFHKLDPNI